MNTLRYIAAIVALSFWSHAGYGQMAFSARTTHKHCPQEPVILKVEQFRGEIQWQQTTDGRNWKNIPGARTGSYSIDPGIETAYRAAIIDGKCDTVYSDTLLVTLDVKLVASVNIKAESLQLCKGATATFNATALNGGSQPEYEWYVNNTLVPGITGSVFTYTPADKDIVHAILTSSESCLVEKRVSSEPISLTVNKLLKMEISLAASATAVCTGSEVTMTATVVNAGTDPDFQWFLNGTEIEGVKETTYKFKPANGDKLYVRLSSAQECLSAPFVESAPVTLTVKEKLLAAVAMEVDQTAVCEGTEVTFRAIPQNGGSNPRYRWFINDRLGNIQSTPTFKYVPMPGDRFHLQMTSNHECVAEPVVYSEAITIEVKKNVLPTINIHASKTEICGEEEVKFSATLANVDQKPVLAWFVNGIERAGETDSIFTFTPLAGDSVYAELTSDLRCVSQLTVRSQILIMGQCVTAATVITGPVSLITHNSAVCEGNVTDDGNAPVMERGICWSTQPEPTTASFSSREGTGKGLFTRTLSGLTENTTYYIRAYVINSKGTSYGETKSFTTDRSRTYSVTQPVAANMKDTINTPGAVLVIPQDALEASGNVTVAVDGKQVIEMQHQDMEVVGEIFNLSLPGNKITDNIYLSFPMPPIDVPRENYLVFLYNGHTYYPVEFTIVNDTVHVVIDIIDWEQYEGNDTKSLNLFSQIIAIGIVYEQTIPKEMLGIKKITLDNEKLVFTDPVPAISPKKLILFVHGWIGDPTTWDVMIPKIYSDSELGYDEIWTFGYNSSLSIEENSQKLRSDLVQYAGNNKIDIVAHSMGGLVSRSMIEFYNGAQFVKKLITLGTPHYGSSLSAIREVIGLLMVVESGLWGSAGKAVFDIKTQGLKDLDNNSSFIKKLKSSLKPANIPYYLIAAINNPYLWPPSNKAFLPGDDDGIVTVQSAFGSPHTLKSEPILMAEMLAHTKMNKEYRHYVEVLKYLKMQPPGNPPVANFSASLTSVTVGSNIQFTDQSENNPTSWSWNFGDGTTSTQQNPVKSYGAADTYTVSLTVTNSYGSNTKMQINYITVSTSGNAPVANFSASSTSATVGSSIQFTDLSANNPTSWSWDFGDGTTSVQQNPAKSYTTAGTYTVLLTVTNSFGTNTNTRNNYILVSEIGGNPTGFFKDNRDNTTYQWVKIGDQIWMAENLAYLPSVSPSSQESETAPYYYVYGYQGTSVSAAKASDNYKTYGVLYNWPAAMVGAASSNLNPSNVQGICPVGWHLPSDSEWIQMMNYLIENGYNFDGTLSGNKIAKSLAATTNWIESTVVGAIGNNLFENNKSGFQALPGGYRLSSNKLFSGINLFGFWWSSTESDISSARRRDLSYFFERMGWYTDKKSDGFSVRCVKDDNHQVSLPTISTSAITTITQTTAIGGGNVTADGGAIVTARGTCWSTSPNPTTANNHTNDSNGTGIFTSNLNGLIANTPYFVRAYAINSAGTSYGNEVTFRTSSDGVLKGTFIDSRDNKTYQWVKIEDQTWMAENLAYLPSVSPSEQGSDTAPHYYVYDYQGTDVVAAKATNNYKTYGALYNWPAAMAGAGSSDSNPSNVRGICPTGWHLPSDAEWKQLEITLGMSQDELDRYSFRGSEEGRHLKSTEGWINDVSGTNSTGFTAIPAGYRFLVFEGFGAGLAWWTSTEESAENAWDRGLSNQTNRIDRFAYWKYSGFSVRCIKD